MHLSYLRDRQQLVAARTGQKDERHKKAKDDVRVIVISKVSDRIAIDVHTEITGSRKEDRGAEGQRGKGAEWIQV